MSATANANQIAARTAAGEDHTDPENKPAEQIAEPVNTRTEIHRQPKIDDTHMTEALGADDSHGGGQQPGAKAAVILERHDVGDCAHGAEIGLLDNETEGRADGEFRPTLTTVGQLQGSVRARPPPAVVLAARLLCRGAPFERIFIHFRFVGRGDVGAKCQSRPDLVPGLRFQTRSSSRPHTDLRWQGWAVRRVHHWSPSLRRQPLSGLGRPICRIRWSRRTCPP